MINKNYEPLGSVTHRRRIDPNRSSTIAGRQGIKPFRPSNIDYYYATTLLVANTQIHAAYRDLLAVYCAAHGVAVWSWVLMPNHVHLVLVPDHADALRAALSKVDRAYAGSIHAREKRTGHFWQGRFGCVAMDKPHLLAALRYAALNPVRARLVERAQDWRWSSVHLLLEPARRRPHA